jgi:hypothetical protein
VVAVYMNGNVEFTISDSSWFHIGWMPGYSVSFELREGIGAGAIHF